MSEYVVKLFNGDLILDEKPLPKGVTSPSAFFRGSFTSTRKYGSTYTDIDIAHVMKNGELLIIEEKEYEAENNRQEAEMRKAFETSPYLHLAFVKKDRCDNVLYIEYNTYDRRVLVPVGEIQELTGKNLLRRCMDFLEAITTYVKNNGKLDYLGLPLLKKKPLVFKVMVVGERGTTGKFSPSLFLVNAEGNMVAKFQYKKQKLELVPIRPVLLTPREEFVHDIEGEPFEFEYLNYATGMVLSRKRDNNGAWFSKHYKEEVK